MAGFRVLFGFVIVANGIGAIYFSLLGAWPVAGFMGLDVLAFLVAFRLSYAQARAFERISIDGQTITVEQHTMKGTATRQTLPSYWANVVFTGDETGGDIVVRSHGKSIPVGLHLPGPERQIFAERLKQALREVRGSVSPVEA
jgi:uncharacterized membrane protein